MSSQSWSTSCVEGKAQSEPHSEIEHAVEDSELPIVQRDYLVLKDIAATERSNVLSRNVKSFGNGTSSIVETKGFPVDVRLQHDNILGPMQPLFQRWRPALHAS